jgi:high-affinity nickel permease
MKNAVSQGTTALVLMVSMAAPAMAADGVEVFTEIGTTVGLLAAAALVLLLLVQKPLVIMKLVKKFLGRST